MAQRVCFALISILSAVSMRAPLGAQGAPTVCPCIEERDFGGCAVAVPANYPAGFPGSAAVVAGNIGGRDVAYLYVADIYEGLTFRYDLQGSGGVLNPNTTPDTLVSPLGSNTTTGVTFNPLDGFLYWAIEDSLVRSSFDSDPLRDLGEVRVIGAVDLVGLRTRLNLPQTGSLGGITFHQARRTFWGVDIVNDIYFEFDEQGHLILEDDKPVSFKNPASNPFGGGAYGNGITYVNLGGQHFFDIPVGSLLDGGATRVARVHAASGGEGDSQFKIGDSAGLFYEIRPAAGSFDFISGIAYWASTCGPTQHTEVVLSIAPANSGNTSKIIQVSVDDPNTAGLTSFTAQVNGSSVVLKWAVVQPYAKLELSRRAVNSKNPAPVLIRTFEQFATDPREFTDSTADGVFEYSMKVTPAAPSTRKLPEHKVLAVVGQGTVVRSAPFAREERPQDVNPFAITFIGSSRRVLVADRETGFAHVFDADLNPVGQIEGPFTRNAANGGETTGVAWDPASDTLLWVLTQNGRSFVRRTDTAGAVKSTLAAIDIPLNIRRTPVVGDVSLDSGRSEFWGIDQVNQVAFSFNDQGRLSGKSGTFQLPTPRTPDGVFGGAVSVVESTPTNLTLDYTAGTTGTSGAGELVRVAYTRSGTEGTDIAVPGVEVFSLDLRSVLQSFEIGGLVAVTDGGSSFEYVVGPDTQTIYKLSMNASLQGQEFKRGEVNNDGGAPNLSDAVTILNFLFRGSGALPCDDAADLNNDEKIELTDAVFLFTYLFNNGDTPPEPFNSCGVDFEGPLFCNTASCS